MNRRGFLAMVLGFVVAAGTGGASVLYTRRRTPYVRELWLRLQERVDPLASRIEAHFAHLRLDPVGVDAFVEDYRALGFENTSTRSNSKFYLTYLGSTDYFDEGRDPEAPIRYVAFFHPYVAPCRNPFARFDDDA